MSRSKRRAQAVAGDRRALASLILTAGAVVVAAMLSTGAEARSATAPENISPPTITGTAATGETLTASQGSWTGTQPITFTWQWLRCDVAGGSCSAIGGATAETYDVAPDDVGSTLRAQVTADGEGDPVSAVSAPTAVVFEVTRPANTAEPVVSGSPVEGATLNTTNGTWIGPKPITYAYQWVRCAADGGLPDGSNCPSIPGATSSSYALTAADVGARLRVQVTASNSNGPATAASNPTDTVTQSTTTGPPRNLVEPSVSGTLAQGQTVFASVGTWAGASTITYTYQWARCGSDGGSPDGSDCTFISGATTSSYVLTSSDVGQRLRIRVTATNSLGSATVASNATAAIQVSTSTTVQQAPRNTFLPSISGTAAVGQTLFASVGTWTGTSPITYTYQWLRCGADGGESTGAGCTAITGATIAQYAPTTTDVGQRLRVQVTARNSLGTATATSNPSAQVLATAPTTPTTPTPPTTPSPTAGLPAGAIRLPNGKYSIPVTSVSPPERLVAGEIDFVPDTVRSREKPIVLRVRVVDTRGHAVRDALVFVRSIPLVTSSPGEVRTGRDGWARVSLTPQADFPVNGKRVQFWIRVRKQGDDVLAGVSNRRLVQVATAR